MGLFGQSTPFDADVEKATSETNTNDNWSLILDVCDKVTTNPRSAKECLKSIMKRMGHSDPHVVMQAITLLDACANNCGKSFHLEIASRDFENEFRRLLTKAQPKVSMKMRQVLKGWVDGDFKNDPELNLIPSLYSKLRGEGYDFSNLNEKPAKANAAKLAAAYKDPNVVSSQQEEEDIAKAIELSLKENKNSPKHTSTAGASTASAYPSLYPTVAGVGSLGSVAVTSNNNAAASAQPERKVRALYDFEAAEENELTFFAGEFIFVVDDSDPNWWKGYNQRGDGLFPSNFVTADLSVEPESLDINQQNKSKKVEEDDEQAKAEAAAAVAASSQPVEIDETKVDRLLHLLHEANPEDPTQDSPEMLRLEQEVHQMGPLIDAELERVDRKHAQLTQLSSDLVDAINLYHSLMASDRAALAGAAYMPGMSSMSSAMPGLSYQGPTNPQMLYGGGGGSSGGNINFSQQPSHLAHNYGQINSLPYNTAVVPPMAMPATTASVAPAPAQLASYAPSTQMAVPMQYRNGDSWNPGNAYSHQMMAPNQQQHQTTNGTHLANGQQQSQQQPSYQSMPAVDPQQQYANSLPQQQQHQQAPPNTQQYISPQHQQPTQQQNPLQYMPPPPAPQQQQQLSHNPHQQQFVPMPNGPHRYMHAPPPGVPQTSATNTPPQPSQSTTSSTLPPAALLHQSNEQFSQLQQQFTAMSMGMPPQQNAVGAGVPQTMANIPIYQQQR